MRPLKLLALSVLALSLTGAAHAQVLNGQWFKATATASGAATDEKLQVEKANFKKLTTYVQLFLDEGFGSHQYSAQIWGQDSLGVWQPLGNGDIAMADAEETYALYAGLTFLVPESVPQEDLVGSSGLQGFDVAFNGPVKVKLKGEEVKSAKIKSDGAIAEGSFSGADVFTGGAKVSLKLVPESKLPFDPTPVLKAGAPAPTMPIQPSWRSQTVEAAPAAVSQH